MPLIAGLLIAALPLLAHHGTGVAYEVDKQVTIKGTVTEWIWANPHCGLLFDVTDDKGNVAHWGAELGNPHSLSQVGYPRDLWEANLRPFEIIQTGDRVLQHMQYHDVWRTIWTDGRALPKNPDPAWYGYSIGRWEGDTFVIESTGYDDRTWLDHFGSPHSDQMVLVERWKRLDMEHLQLDISLTDPKAYTAPWVGDPIVFDRVKVGIFEEICAPSEENHFNDQIRDPAAGAAKP